MSPDPESSALGRLDANPPDGLTGVDTVVILLLAVALGGGAFWLYRRAR